MRNIIKYKRSVRFLQIWRCFFVVNNYRDGFEKIGDLRVENDENYA